MKKTSTLSLMTLGICSALSLSVNAQLINEGFESGAVPPSGWTLDNPDGLTTWSPAFVGKTGSKSTFINVFDQTKDEQWQSDALITSAVDLSSVTNPTLTFQRAYQMYSNPATYTPVDAFNVYISIDGGTTWSSIFNQMGTALITAANQTDSVNGFVPTSSEWALENVDLSAYSTATSAQFKFEFVNDWENNFYLDDIMVSGSGNGVNDVNLNAYVSVFPNPSHGNINVNLAAFGLDQIDIVVYNMVGEEVEHISQNLISPKRVKINLEDQPNGIYFVRVKTDDGITTKKMILNK